MVDWVDGHGGGGNVVEEDEMGGGGLIKEILKQVGLNQKGEVVCFNF